ncbi:MAG: dicarboxylate/amino acid:cation symporter [Spirochaetia bacterium]|nr:dicarboxylate/amino acid:cation symporter [Spirochaetia bacterium]
MQKKFVMKGQDTIREILDFNCQALKDFKLDSKERLRTELTCEEVLMRLLEHGNFEKRNTISININKFLGNVSIDMRVPGDDFEFLPRPAFDDMENDEETAESIQNIILRSLGDRISFRRSGDYNTARVQVYRSQYFNLYLILTSLILAIITGLGAKYLLPEHVCNFINENIFNSFISLFMNGLKMCAVPLVFFSIVTCFTQTDSLSGIKRVGLKLFSFIIVFMCFAAFVGYFSVRLLRTGVGMHFTAAPGAASADMNNLLSIKNILIDVVPNNIVRPFSEGNMVQLIVLAILVGVACGACKIKIVTSIFDELNRLFMKIIGFFIHLLPIFVFCSVSSLFIITGSKVLLSVLGILYTAIFAKLLLFLTYLTITAFLGLNPLEVLKKSMHMLLTAFTTASSIAAMPDAMKAAGDLGVTPKLYKFSIPVGMTLFKSSLLLYLIIVVCSTANIYGIDMPLSKVISVAFSAIVLVMAMPGIPGVGVILVSTLLTMAGCPIDALGLVIGIDPVIDMLATPIGVFGVLAAVLTVAKSEKLLNK